MRSRHSISKRKGTRIAWIKGMDECLNLNTEPQDIKVRKGRMPKKLIIEPRNLKSLMGTQGRKPLSPSRSADVGPSHVH